jgi:C4-dicarboxylate-specific signal transduction histidine kinase
MADRVQIQQVVMNLIPNGIEAMSAVEERERDLVNRTQRSDGIKSGWLCKTPESALIH